MADYVKKEGLVQKETMFQNVLGCAVMFCTLKLTNNPSSKKNSVS
jgi:hypothetical protein